MSQEERRPGWLSRVFGAPDAMQPGEDPVAQLEEELARWRAAYASLEEAARAREAELEAEQAARSRAEAALAVAMRGRDEARAKSEADAVKLGAELAQKAKYNEAIASLRAELEAARVSAAKLGEELEAARAEAARERTRAAAVQASYRQVVASHDVSMKRAQERRAELERERDALAGALRDADAARTSDRDALAGALRDAEAARANEREQLERARAEREAAVLALESRSKLALSALAALAGGSTRALDVVLGAGAPIAFRAPDVAPAFAAAVTADREHAASAVSALSALSALEEALRATGWLRRLELVEGERVEIVAHLETRSSAVRAVVERGAAAWLGASTGREIVARAIPVDEA